MKDTHQREVFVRNLAKYMKIRGVEQADIVSALGITASTVSDWVNGKKYPRVDAMQRLADYLGVLLSDLTREEFDTQVRAVRIPVLGSIPAGVPLEAIEDILDWEEIPSSWTQGGAEFFALRVEGDSMFPRYEDGDIIILHKQATCDSGQDCAVMVNGNDATFKRVKRNMEGIVLQPINPAYDPMVFTNKQIEELPVTILGVVVELRRGVGRCSARARMR